MSRLDKIKARAEQVHWTSTSIEQAMARMASSAADVPWLLAEVERLTAERDALAQIKRHIDEVRNGTGWTVQIYGVLLQQCDQYGKTIDTRRADKAEAERDALAATHARESEKVWKVEEVMDDIEGSDPTTWERLRDALAGPEADTSYTQSTDQEDQS